jgi:PQQ-dependent catabolism-associated CXXCW motif protein
LTGARRMRCRPVLRAVPLAFLALAATAASSQEKCYFGECSGGTGTAPGASAPPPDRTPSATPSPAPRMDLPPAPTALNYADELTDFGVSPQPFLRYPVAGPTPMSIPGGSVVTTGQIRGALDSGRRDFILVDALDAPGHQTIPGAVRIPFAGEAGSFRDPVQSQLYARLMQLTNGRTQYPLVFFCEGSKCWESYNAALRAINMGFNDVYWYRGGIDAWQAAGLPMAYGY